MARIAMDTSALMLPVEADVWVFEEVERLLEDADPVVPRSVLAELAELSAGSGVESRAASVGSDLARRHCRVLDGENEESEDDEDEYADDVLVDLARTGAVDYVATADRALCERVLAENVPVLALRGRNKLTITRP